MLLLLFPLILSVFSLSWIFLFYKVGPSLVFTIIDYQCCNKKAGTIWARPTKYVRSTCVKYQGGERYHICCPCEVDIFCIKVGRGSIYTFLPLGKVLGNYKREVLVVVKPLLRTGLEFVTGMAALLQGQVDSATDALSNLNIDYAKFMGLVNSAADKSYLGTTDGLQALNSYIQTKETFKFASRLLGKKPRSVIHVENGCGEVSITNDKLHHQVDVIHTPKDYFDSLQGDFTNATIDAIQITVTPSVARGSNSTMAMVLVDSAYQNLEDAMIAGGTCPLGQENIHWLTIPSLNLSYKDKNFLDRLQLLVALSSDLKGSGNIVATISTSSIVLHNRVAGAFQKSRIAWETVRKTLPSPAVSTSKVFQALPGKEDRPCPIEVPITYTPRQVTNLLSKDGLGGFKLQRSLLTPTTLHITPDFAPSRRYVGTPRLVPELTGGKEGVKEESGCCTVHSEVADSAVGAGFDIVGAGFEFDDEEELRKTRVECGTETILTNGFQSLHFTGVPNLEMPKLPMVIAEHKVDFDKSSEAGKKLWESTLFAGMAGASLYGRVFSLLSHGEFTFRVRLSCSLEPSAHCLLRLFYDEGMRFYGNPSRHVATKLPGMEYQPGRDSIAVFDFTPVGLLGQIPLSGTDQGFGKLFLIVESPISGDLETSPSVNIQISIVKAEKAVPAVGAGVFSGLPKTLPCRQIIARKEWKVSDSTKKSILVPLLPGFPAVESAKAYPSMSSTLFENCVGWKGDLVVELVVVASPLSTGTLRVALAPFFSLRAVDASQYGQYGFREVDLRSTRRLLMRCNMNTWTRFAEGGRGRCNKTYTPEITPMLIINLATKLNAPKVCPNAILRVRLMEIENADLMGLSLARESRFLGAGSELSTENEYPLFTLEGSREFASIRLPITPACLLPDFGDWVHHIAKNNVLSHRAQEFLYWRGSLTYTVYIAGDHQDKSDRIMVGMSLMSASSTDKAVLKINKDGEEHEGLHGINSKWEALSPLHQSIQFVVPWTSPFPYLKINPESLGPDNSLMKNLMRELAMLRIDFGKQVYEADDRFVIRVTVKPGPDFEFIEPTSPLPIALTAGVNAWEYAVISDI